MKLAPRENIYVIISKHALKRVVHIILAIEVVTNSKIIVQFYFLPDNDLKKSKSDLRYFQEPNASLTGEVGKHLSNAFKIDKGPLCVSIQECGLKLTLRG